MLHKLLRAALLFLLLLVPVLEPVNAEKNIYLESDELIVHFPESLKTGAEELLALYPAVRRSLEENIGWAVPFRPLLVLVNERDRFRRAVGSDFVVAFARPGENLIVIDYSRMTLDPFRIEITLKHELCHLLLHHYIPERHLPRWFDEGIAQWVSDGVGESLMEQREGVLNQAVLSGKLISLRALAGGFPRDRRSIALAYQQSKSIVFFVIEEFGKDRLLALLESLKVQDIEAAIPASLALSFEELEERWMGSLERNMTWFTFLSGHLYGILFFVAALAAVYGFIKTLARKRAYGREEEEGPWDEGAP